jgi:hypothetical protein
LPARTSSSGLVGLGGRALYLSVRHSAFLSDKRAGMPVRVAPRLRLKANDMRNFGSVSQ